MQHVVQEFIRSGNLGPIWKPNEKRGKPPRLRGNDALIGALQMYGQLSITDLAVAMGCSVGESSKRVKAAGGLVEITRVGKRKLVNLKIKWG